MSQLSEAEAAPATAGSPSLAARFERVDWKPWRLALTYVVLTRAIFYLVALGTTMFMAAGFGPNSEEGFLDIWERWDARHFQVVAEHGWTGPEAESARAGAFFPLYPLVIRALASIGFDTILAGLLVSAVSTVVACTYLIKLADFEIGEGAGRRAALYLILFPTAVFLVAPYSEALFLAGAIPAFYFARRGMWWHAALPAAVAVATRAAGMFLLAGLAVELVVQLFRNKESRPARLLGGVTTLIAGSIPIVAYALYLQAVRGNAFQFFVDQRDGWGRNFVGPIDSFIATWNTRAGSYPTNWIFAWRIEIIAALFGILVTVWAMVRRDWGYATFMGVFMVALMTSSWYFSIPRMLLSFFPIPLYLAGYVGDHDTRHELILLGLVPIATMGVIVFTRGAWFY